MTTYRSRGARDNLRQNNTRGMGLARDVKAGQALPVPSRAQKRAAIEAERRAARRRRRSQDKPYVAPFGSHPNVRI